MRQLVCAIGALAAMLSLAGCGQSGDLQLTSDPHLDTRPKYLLYHPKEQQQPHQEERTASDLSPSQVQ
ncbi:LPS translocon maturation chaperone LptM [Acinetobacter sp. MD2(2019)]|uniref:LPS translocon maturation chaperone LptM n=1 Tax=Acinetobacter sp. MD2(2019) TaxID=2605273 RepID=UPI002D788C46|nr:lipoprotein [Acinetobacter sp. MD2(2019)]